MNGFIKLSSPATREFWKIPVLFEDEHLLILDKPAGLLTSPARQDPERPSLIRLLHEGVAERKPWAAERQLGYLMNVHRLDGEISGALMLAKSKPVLSILANAFGSEIPILTYLVLVKGGPNEDHGLIEAGIAQDMKYPGRMRIDGQKGKRARTTFTVQETFHGFTLLRCQPLTERRDQVRVHLKYAGWPVCGDRIYGGRPLYLSKLKPNYRLKTNRTERPLIGSTAVHAAQLSFPHPVGGERLVVEAPLPKDFQVALKYLRQFAPATGARSETHAAEPSPPAGDNGARA